MPATRRANSPASSPKSPQLEIGVRFAGTMCTKCRARLAGGPSSVTTCFRNAVSGGIASCGCASSITASSDVPERGQPTITGNGLRNAAPAAAPEAGAASGGDARAASLIASQALDRQRRRLAAADAQRRDAAPAAGLAQRAQQRDDDARAGRADRMAERACAAVDVDLVV